MARTTIYNFLQQFQRIYILKNLYLAARTVESLKFFQTYNNAESTHESILNLFIRWRTNTKAGPWQTHTCKLGKVANLKIFANKKIKILEILAGRFFHQNKLKKHVK